MASEKKADDIGALWIKRSKGGDDYFSGEVNGQNIVIFRNKFKKKGERTPDWRIFAQVAQSHSEEKPVHRKAQQGSERDDVGEVPF